jgi:hypothetical protein
MAARKRRAGPSGEEFAFTTQLIVLGTGSDGDPVDTLVLEWGGRVDPADAQQSRWPKHLHLLRRIMFTWASFSVAFDDPNAGRGFVNRYDLRTVFA